MLRDVKTYSTVKQESNGSYTYIRKFKKGFKSKMVTRDKEGYYIMINRSIHQGNITIINTYVPEKWYPL